MTTDAPRGGTEPFDACPATMERILEADPGTLTGDGDDDLARHLRECPRCARAAALLLDASGGLARALAEPGRPVDAAAVVRAARARRGRRGRTRTGWAVAGLAAAAAVAALLLVPRPPRGGPPPGVPASAPSPGLDLVASRDVAVLSGENPDITILWFFDAQGGAP